MKHRLSLGPLMAAIAILAFNLAAYRVVADREFGETILFGGPTLFQMGLLVGPMLLVAQVALARVAVGRRSTRPFWAGLAASALAVGPLSLWFLRGEVAIATQWSTVYLFGYRSVLMARFPTWPIGDVSDRSLGSICFALYMLLPQLGAALLIALAATFAVRLIVGGRAALKSV